MRRDLRESLACGRHHERQRQQRHHRAGGEEGAPVDGAFRGGLREKRQRRAGEDEQPKKASTTLGAPAIIWISRFHRSRQPTTAEIDSHTATATPIGAANAIPIAVSSSVPSIGSRNPPDPL